MNILDENIPDNQRHLLKAKGIHVRQIGFEIGRKGMKDEEIIPFLHKIGSVTFFTRDLGFYHPQLCHSKYCLVCLAISQYEVASFIRRFLKHPEFNTQAKRVSKVIRLSHLGIKMWERHVKKEQTFEWALS